MKNHKYNFPVGAAMAALLACAAPQSARGEVEDITAQYVSNADFTGAQSVWNINSNMSSTQQGNSCQEFWNGDINSAYFQMSQTVHGLPDGVYRLTANAFTRSAGDNSRQTCLYAIADGKEYATPLKLLHEETGAYGSTPDNPAQAKAAFAAGYWLNTVDHIVVTGGQLTIGARNMGQLRTGSSNGSWTILGRIRLYSLTGSDLSSLMDNTLADAQALANEGNHTGQDALQTAIAAAQSVPVNLLEGDDILALQQAMATYRASRMGDATEANPVDATHLVRNAGFEDGFIPVLPTANGGYAFPAGWEGSYGETDVNNNIGRGMEGTIQSGYNAEISPSEGKQALAARMRWSSGSVMEVSQKLQLPAGKYSLSADLGNLAVDESATVTVEDGDGTALCSLSPTSSTLATQSSTFEVVQSTGSTLRIKLVQSGQTDARMVVDNIRLSYFGAASLSTEAQQEAMLPRLDKLTEEFIADFNNRPMQKSSWKTLVQRVAESEAAKDNTDATPATLKEAADNLEAAMRNAAPSVAAYHRLSTTLDLFSENEGALAEGSFRDLYLEAQALFSAATATAEEADEAAASLRKAYPGYLASTLATSFDVTAFIANPSFEDGEAPAAVDEPNIYAPSGWNVEFEADNAYTGYKHIRSIPYGTAYDGTTPESSDEENGTALLYMRTNWDAAQNMRVYQDVWLPAGKYRLSADINHLSGTPDRQYTYVETGGTHLSLWPSATGTWETVTQEFELEEDGEITLSFGFSTPGGNNAVKLLADHVKLELVPPTYITNYVAAMQEALKWQEQLDATAFPSVAERLSAAIGTEVGNGEEAAYLAATALLQEAAAYGRSACAINQENGDATGILANPEANEGTTGWETSLTSIQNRESYKGTTDN